MMDYKFDEIYFIETVEQYVLFMKDIALLKQEEKLGWGGLIDALSLKKIKDPVVYPLWIRARTRTFQKKKVVFIYIRTLESSIRALNLISIIVPFITNPNVFLLSKYKEAREFGKTYICFLEKMKNVTQ